MTEHLLQSRASGKPKHMNKVSNVPGQAETFVYFINYSAQCCIFICISFFISLSHSLFNYNWVEGTT